MPENDGQASILDVRHGRSENRRTGTAQSRTQTQRQHTAASRDNARRGMIAKEASMRNISGLSVHAERCLDFILRFRPNANSTQFAELFYSDEATSRKVNFVRGGDTIELLVNRADVFTEMSPV